MVPENRPIGHWIKQADLLLTAGIDRIQASFGLTRTSWQVLHTLHEQEPDLTVLLGVMEPFAGKDAVMEIIRQFSAQELLLESDKGLRLSQPGIHLHTRCFAMQQSFRKSVMTGISSEDYGIAVSVLQKIVQNIESRNEEL